MFHHGRHVFLLALPIEPCARVPLMLSARDETRFCCFATRKVADFRFLLHLLSRYRVFPVIPGARPRGSLCVASKNLAAEAVRYDSLACS
ncbi:hypothetical protein NDU88_001132 [Pleurodeles waltl]|uniref:Secreted protein n=1 Tax=Pleurodeles waltl TaxID=8319 RepID=A0AAV7WMP0_PLEWA|nr:hypothetical protein NDU88_001132 [Pleurodeles waltl]